MSKQSEKLNEMSEKDLNKKLISLREKIQDLRFKAEGSKNKDVKVLSNTKKEIARVLTVLNKKNKTS